MTEKILKGLLAAALAGVAAGCGGGADTSNANTNTNGSANSNAGAAASADPARTAPDNSEVRTETAGGVTTETRTFRNASSPVERVVVTTRDGRRTARVYYRDNSSRDLPEGDVERALSATADTLAAAGGRAVDATKAAGAEVGDKAEDVKDAAVDGAKKAGSEAADKTEDAAGKAASGAKKAGRATAKGAKKAGEAVKDAITP